MNYTEHLVANAYITGQMSFVQVLICLPLFGFFNIGYDVFNWVFLLSIVGYQFFVFKKIYHIGFWSTLFRALVYLIMLAILMLGIGILIVTIILLTGSMSIEDFAPK